MDGLLLHPRTRQQASVMLGRQPHGILITGPGGSGKETLSYAFAAALIKTDKLDNYPYFQAINSEGDSISIDEIRDLQQFLKLKVPSVTQQEITRVVYIHNASRMRQEAQNALLKTLEEPPAHTAIILSAESPDQLLPTITSRTSLLNILPVSEDLALEYFGNKGQKSADIKKFYALAQGQAGLLHALLHDESHPLLDQVALAKVILSEKPSERLYRVDELSKDKTGVKLLINAMGRISHAALSTASRKNDLKSVKKWHKTQASVQEAALSFGHNPNTKLLLDNLFLSI